jgi:release factor glutamine methyltransferase
LTLHTALRQGTKLLEDAGVPVSRLTAEVLLAHAVKREKTYLYTHPEEPLSEVAWIHYGRYLNERLRGKPTQYITGRQEFYGREFLVNSDVLIPRPETEHVVECVLELPRGRIVDVGCGSGAIAITLSLETGAPVVAADISLAALKVASRNHERLRADVRFAACDILSAFTPGSFEIIVSNPPYVPLADAPGMQREVRDFEPDVALFAGLSGLEVYSRIIEEARPMLVRGGWLVMELGFRAEPGVRAMLAGWREVHVEPDLAGIPRVIIARL